MTGRTRHVPTLFIRSHLLVSKLDRNLNPFKKLYCAYPKNSETGVSPDVASLMSVAAAREQKKDKNTQGARERERELAARCIGEKKREVGERKKNCYSPFFLGLINGTPLFSTFCPDLGPTAAAAEMEREPFFVLLLFCARRRPRHRRRYFYTSCPFFSMYSARAEPVNKTAWAKRGHYD
jgi:hypothetical protein